MKKRPLIEIQLFIISVLFITLATSCKKSDEKDPAIIKDGDGNTYTSVTIGTQVWLVENLKSTKLNDGTQIPMVTDNTEWKNLTTLAYCWYNNDEATYKSDYGVLYNWYAVNTGKLCPKGWHVPSSDEMDVLDIFIDNNGGKLKEVGTTHWLTPNTGATDQYGFKALPGGYRSNSGSFGDINTHGAGWTTTVNTQWNTADIFILYYNGSNWTPNTDVNKNNGYAVRCIKD